MDGREGFGGELGECAEGLSTGASETVLSNCGGLSGNAFSDSCCLNSGCGAGDGTLGFVDFEVSIVGDTLR